MIMPSEANQRRRIIGQSYFEPFPTQPLLLEKEFVRFDQSLIWRLNHFFWQHSQLWERTYGEYYEESLPGGLSLSHRPEFIEASARRFIVLLSDLKRANNLPVSLYILEKGVGSGAYALGFLNYLRAYSELHHEDFYERLRYIIYDP